jgi:hypothetical protein
MKITRNPTRTKIRSIESEVSCSAGGIAAVAYKLQITDSPEFGEAGYFYDEFRVHSIKVYLIPIDPIQKGFLACAGNWTEDDSPISAGSSFDTQVENADPPGQFAHASKQIVFFNRMLDTDYRDIADEQSGTSKIGTHDFVVYGKNLGTTATTTHLVVVEWDITFK